MTERIVGKVARVNSDRELIINRGAGHGVQVGTVFRIMSNPIQVTDPDSEEVLGLLRGVKVFVKVEETDEKFCIARTFRSKRVRVGGGLGLSGLSTPSVLREVMQPPKYEYRYETLKRDELADGPISSSESVVQKGDTAESMLDDEDIDATTTTLWR